MQTNMINVIFGIGSNSCNFKNCRVNNALSSSVQALNSADLLIENCTFADTGTVNNDFAFLELGSIVNYPNPAINTVYMCNDCIVRGCLLSMANAGVGSDALLVTAGSNILIEDSVIATNAPVDENVNYMPAALHIGLADTFTDNLTAIVNNVRVRNCVLSDTGSIGVRSESGNKGIVVENCQIENTLIDGVSINANTMVTLKNNQIKNSLGGGILFSGDSSSSAILGNIISNNAGAGITLNSTCTTILVYDNQIFSNSSAGILDEAAKHANREFHNIAYNNVPNYSGSGIDSF
jgi:hypothetical protein